MTTSSPALPVDRSFLLDRLWSMLPRTLAISMPVVPLRRAIGGDAVRWLDDVGCAFRTALEPGAPYPCPRGSRCGMRVAADRRTVRCSQRVPQCTPLVLENDDAVQVEITAQSLVRLVQRSLGLAPGWQPGGTRLSLIELGQRRIGDRIVDCVLLADPENEAAKRWLDLLSRDHPERALAVIVVRREDLPRATPPHNQVWLALADGLPTFDGLHLDLALLWDRFAPGVDPGETAWPPFLWVADPKNYWFRYAGRPIDLQGRPQHTDLLAHLLVGRGAWRSRKELIDVLWKGVRPYQVESRWAQVRGLKRDLAKEIGELGLPASLSEPILTRTERPGGYQIANGGAVRWLSEWREDVADRA